MSANLRKLRSEVPRSFEVVSRDNEKDSDPTRRKLGRNTVRRRLEPLMGLIASGEVPMDEHTATAIAAYLDKKGS